MTNRLHQSLPIHFTTHHHFQYFHPTLPYVALWSAINSLVINLYETRTNILHRNCKPVV